MSSLSTATREELVKVVYELIDENQALKSQVVELQNRLKEKGNGPKENPLPAFVKLNRPKKESQERKKREVNFSRKRGAPDQKVFHCFDQCPDCGGTLGKPSVSYSREIIDIPLPKAGTTEHVVFKRWCFTCRKRVAPQVNFSALVAGKHRVGVNLMSVITTLRERLRLPLNQVQQYLSSFYDLSLSEGEMVSILDHVANKGKTDYEEIKDRVRSSKVVYADETGNRENGRNGYTWSFSTNTDQLLLYRKSRSKRIVSEALNLTPEGLGFDGVVVSDFYTSYNEHTGFHQRCWAHFLRDIHELKEKIELENHPDKRMVFPWAERIENIFNLAKSYTGPPQGTKIGLEAEMRVQKETEFKDKLRSVCTPYLTIKSPQSTLCGRAIKYLPEMFTFIRFPEVEPTNNKAERDLRHFVVQRKISGGTRSAKGSETREILGSLFGTWRIRGLNPLEQSRLLLVGTSCQ